MLHEIICCHQVVEQVVTYGISFLRNYYTLSPIDIVFCLLLTQVQNRAIYSYFIIICNVHFFSNNITFWTKRHRDRGQMII